MKLSQNNLIVIVSLFIVIGGIILLSFSASKEEQVTSTLNNVRLLVATGSDHQVFNLGSKKLEQKFSEIEGDVVDYIVENGTEALIVSHDGVHRVLARVAGEEWRVVSESPFEKATLELSADGTTLGFSERIETEMDSTKLEAWQMVIHSLDTSETTVISGYAPQFVTITEGWTLVYFSSAEGMAMYEPVSEKIVYSKEIIPPSTQLPIKVSSDGTKLIAYNEIIKDFMVFDLQDPTSINLSALGTIPLYNDIYIRNGTLFGLDLREEESFVWTHSFSELDTGNQIYTLPENINPLKFILSSK